MRRESLQSKACETQEAMLARFPAHVYQWDCETNEAVAFEVYVGLLREAVFKGGPKPRIDKAWNIYGSSCDKVMPRDFQDSRWS